jgi:hypothetical protein
MSPIVFKFLCYVFNFTLCKKIFAELEGNGLILRSMPSHGPMDN